MIQLDWEEFDKLCQMFCTKREIANWFCVSQKSIDRCVQRDKEMGFDAYYEQKSDGGRIALRRVQLQTALGGNVTMQIFLGKQKLGQIDEKIVKSDVTLHSELMKLLEEQDDKTG